MATTDHVNVQRIGPYTKGEIPRALDITFKDLDGTVLNLTGFSADMVIIAVDKVVAGLGAGASTIPTPLLGLARYAITAADVAVAGMFRAQMWADAGTTRYASDVFEYIVEDITENPF